MFFVSRALVGVQPSVTSKEGDEEEELYRTNYHGYKVKRELSDDELPEEVQRCRTRSHDDSSNSSKGDDKEKNLFDLIQMNHAPYNVRKIVVLLETAVL